MAWLLTAVPCTLPSNFHVKRIELQYRGTWCLQGTESFCCEDCQQIVIAGGVRVTFAEWDSPNGTTECRGQYPGAAWSFAPMHAATFVGHLACVWPQRVSTLHECSNSFAGTTRAGLLADSENGMLLICDALCACASDQPVHWMLIMLPVFAHCMCCPSLS